MKKLGVVTGLVFEAQVVLAAARAAGCADEVMVLCLGPGRARAAMAAQKLVDDGAEILLSMGLAGGIDPALRSGDVILARSVRSADHKKLLAADSLFCALSRALESAPGGTEQVLDQNQAGDLSGFYTGSIIEAVVPAASHGAKRALFRESGAMAVDMESYGVAKIAARAGLPFLALRVIADPADQEIPQSALLGMRPDGTLTIWPVIRALASHPGMLPELLRLGRQSKTAQGVLGRFGERVFGFARSGF
ncbi:purine phosphorylase [Iodidimonas nitroreducens]|uniref:Purine phosphorylase n=1 Tax=Iodidimonas nitroreducens TaxID=1236968 RepID=A0A5A7NAG2_9PROT|nr:hypothetical protein [Iodidimonas nitroreducens]GAK33517.1 5'-methylthioadenosine/S-adenosylhomocysteine nucleosidase [alpha proteobacterium Q-1]GER04460.1 purine phosphorylase [Iodidimonas nitroreducens]